MDSTLPLDVLRDLGRWLPQNDLIHLAFTCRRLYRALHEHIYSAIVIDSSKRVFCLELAAECTTRYIQTSQSAFEPVVIRSLYALTRFLKTLIAHPQYAQYIRILVAQDRFPDVPALDLKNYLIQVFPHLDRLQVLNWYSPDCPLQAELLALLPRPERLESLCGNFQSLHTNFCAKNFFALRHVDISGFPSAEASAHIDFSKFHSLESLTLSRNVPRNRISFASKLDRCCRKSVETQVENLTAILSAPKAPLCMSQMISSQIQTPHRLRSLVLRDISVTPSDGRTLLENIDGTTLNHLSLENCVEQLFEPDFYHPNEVRIVRRNPPAVTFMDAFFAGITHLRSLDINLTNELCYNDATLRAISKLKGLLRLSVHLKHFCRRGAYDIKPLITALRTHRHTLKHLNICINVVERINASSCPKKVSYYELDSLHGLCVLTHLRILRLPVKYEQIEEIPLHLSQLKNIEILHLVVTDSNSLPLTASCNNCENPAMYALCKSNSLIATEYFDGTSSYANSLKEENANHFLEFAVLYKQFFPKLAYLRIDLNDQSFLFDCRSASFISFKDQVYLDHFDLLTSRHLSETY
ncbi:hypothetical protein OXX79_007704 [Metschnikowia pulcherrima]